MDLFNNQKLVFPYRGMGQKTILVIIPAVVLMGIVAISVSGQIVIQENPEGILFTNVNVFDGTGDRLEQNMNVLVVENKIHTISSSEIPVNANSTVIDGHSMTLMPGLIDSHVHFNVVIEGGLDKIEASRWDRIAAIAVSSAQEWFMDGFTTVRDMGGLGNGVKMTIDEGLLDGPRIYPSGSYISQTAGHGDIILGSQRDPQTSNLVRLGITQIADGEDAVRAAVRKNFAEGASQIKIMIAGGISSEKGPLFAPQYTNAEIKAAVEEAEARDTYVAVHVYHTDHIKRALELGVKSIEHGQFIDEPTAQLLKEKDAFISPYLASTVGDGVFSHPVYGKEGSPQNLKTKEFQQLSTNFVDVIKKVKPKIVFAVDVVNEVGIDARKHRDYEKWVVAEQFGNYEALKSMTSTAGELMALTGKNNPYPGKLGVIEPGAYADILIINGNPLEDITVIGANPKLYDAEPREKGIDTILLIMKDGVIYKNTLRN